MNRFIASTLALSLLGGCGLDPQIWGNLTSGDYADPPPAGTNVLQGVASAFGAGAAVTFFAPAGAALADYATTTGDGGTFAAALPATTTFVNTVVAVSGPKQNALGVAPQVPAKKTVYDAAISVTLGTDLPGADNTARAVPFMDDLGAESTAATLLLLAKARYALPPTTLASISPSALVGALEEIDNLIGSADARVTPFVSMVDRLFAANATTKAAFVPFPAGTASYLDATALAAATDYTGDGTPDTDSAAFEQALRTAIAALEFNVCYADDRIRVVLMVDFNDGGVDRNCSTLNRWKWTLNEAGKSMFVTGSLHESTPNCDSSPPPCLANDVFDAASQKLGNWTPNITPMYDDGTNGDEIAGDNIWTFSTELPWFDAGAPEAKWVRISYKYTWGTQGALWTGSEEWPGNQRILELRDVNGDRMIVRRDFYGDETTNKNASNLLAPSKGGCGTVLFASDLNPPPEGRRETCVDDTLENLVDFDKDCVLDDYASPGPSTPATIPCPE